MYPLTEGINHSFERTGYKLRMAASVPAGLHRDSWLAKRFRQLGVESSVNIARDYLDDLRVLGRTGK